MRIKEDSAKYFLTKLKKEGIIEHIGSTKNGYWDIKQSNNCDENGIEYVTKNDTNNVTVMSQKDHSNVTVTSQKYLSNVTLKLQKNGYILNRHELDILCLIYDNNNIKTTEIASILTVSRENRSGY